MFASLYAIKDFLTECKVLLFNMLKAVVLLSFLIVCCLGAVPRLRRPRPDGRIAGGTTVEMWSDVEYLGSLEHNGQHVCGSVIIGSYSMLTSATCVYGLSASDIRFRIRTTSRESGGEIHRAAKIFIHPDFDFYKTDYDVAVVQLLDPIGFSGNPNLVHGPEFEPAAGTIATVTGWGITSSESGLAYSLQALKVPIVDRNKCNQLYGAYGGITERMICAGFEEGGKGACFGDTGGPLVFRNILYGLYSWGVGCGAAGYPGVYTNIHNVNDFIGSVPINPFEE